MQAQDVWDYVCQNQTGERTIPTAPDFMTGKINPRIPETSLDSR